MDKAHKYMLDFTKEHIKNKDLVLRKIEKIEEKENGFFVKYKHKETNFVAEPHLSEKTFELIEKLKNVTIITLNSKENVSFLIKKWKDFAKNMHLCIYFINPFSITDKVWIIFPYTHDRVADNSSLELGLKTMAENVTETNTEEFSKSVERKIK